MVATTATHTSAATRSRLPLAALFCANLISQTGSMLTFVAIPWFVLQTTGSATKAGLTGFFEALPYFAAGFFGGALVDRLGFKRTSVLADLANGATVAAVPLLYFTVGLSFWQLQALVFLGGLLTISGSTARAALVPDLAALAGLRLERANATVQAIQRGAQLLGAPLAGVLIAALGARTVLWLDAATFLCSALAIGAFVPRITAACPQAGRYLDDLREGLRYLRRDRLMTAIAVIVAITNLLDTPFAAIVLPFWTKATQGSTVPLGLLLAVGGGGSLLGALVYGAVGHRLPRRKTFVGAFVVAGLPFWVLAAGPTLIVLLVARLLGGLASGPINPILATAEQERIPVALRGRVFGLITAIAYMAIPLGLLVTGFLLDRIGLRATVLLTACCYLATTLSMAIIPAFRDLDTPAR
ncbi:MAG: MFS transporter [Thermomicrobiales bacterium]